jgi:hypothetical protein
VAQAWLAEIGPAPHLYFSSQEKLACWVSLCPGNNISARKRKHGRTGDAGTYIKPVLVQAAWSAIRGRGRLQARYNRLVRRFGGDKNSGAKKKAITAIAHTLLKIAYRVLKTGTSYQDLGADFYTRRESPEQKQAYLERQLQRLHPGCTITITITPEAALPASPTPSSPGPEPPPIPETPPTRQTNHRDQAALNTARARVRCRAPHRDPVSCQQVAYGQRWIFNGFDLPPQQAGGLLFISDGNRDSNNGNHQRPLTQPLNNLKYSQSCDLTWASPATPEKQTVHDRVHRAASRRARPRPGTGPSEGAGRSVVRSLRQRGWAGTSGYNRRDAPWVPDPGVLPAVERPGRGAAGVTAAARSILYGPVPLQTAR